MIGIGIGIGFRRQSGGSVVEPLPPEFATVALGIAGVADNEPFMVQQIDSDGYHLTYARRSARAEHTGWLAVSAAAIANEVVVLAKLANYSAAPTDGVLLIPPASKRSGGRNIPNMRSTVFWSLNMTDALYPRDEEGNTTPTRTASATTDPLGNTQAVRVEWTNSTHNLELFNRATVAGFPTTNFDVTISARIKAVGGAAEIGIGSASRTAGSYFQAAPTSDWVEIGGVISNYGAQAWDLTYVPATAGFTNPFTVDLYGTFMAGDSGPLVVPPLADLRAEVMAGHAKAAIGYMGAIPEVGGWLTPSAVFTNALMPLAREALSAWTIATWVDFSKTDYGGSFAAAAAFMNTPDTGTTTLSILGALGMNVTNYGRLYINPTLSTSVGRAPTIILGQGPTHLAVTVTRGVGLSCTVTAYVNGVPLYDNVENIAATIAPEFLSIGGMDNSRPRKADSLGIMETPDKVGDTVFLNRSATGAEISAIYEAGRQTLAAAAPKKLLAMGSFDSLTAFAEAPFMSAVVDASLRPGVHAHLDAVGGSRYGSEADNAYDSVDRQGLRRRALAAGAAHYDEVYWLCQYGTNDLVSGVMDPGASGTWTGGRDTIDAMIAADVASVPAGVRSKIKRVLITIPAHGGFYNDWVADGSPATLAAASINGPKREVSRKEYNIDCRNNFLSRGYDYLIDMAAHVPAGFATQELAAGDAVASGNAIFQVGGVHWTVAGGAAAAADRLTPFLAARRTAL